MGYEFNDICVDFEMDVDKLSKYACITCFDKNLYSRQNIQNFFDFLIKINLTFPYLVKPIPPKQVLNKIKVVVK